MKTDAELRMQGMQTLITAMGLVEAERFLAAVSKDRFNYTEWRRSGLPELTIDAIAQQANALSEGFQAEEH